MIKIKKLLLQNYCGYEDFEIDFTENNTIKQWAIMYGPNGIGKSNLLEAVNLLTNTYQIRGRQQLELFLRKITYHQNYDPTYAGFMKEKNCMRLTGIFETLDGDKEVIVENNWDDETSGLIKDEIGSNVSQSLYVDADNPMNMFKFQLHHEYANEFLDFAKAVYGFNCYIPEEKVVQEFDPQKGEYFDLCLDFVIEKPDRNKTKVHFKRMSDGEKKIATMLRSLFNRAYKNDNINILLIDNIEMHIYFKRHLILLEKMEQFFSDKQIITTTHSSKIVENVDLKYLYDLENLTQMYNC